MRAFFTLFLNLLIIGSASGQATTDYYRKTIPGEFSRKKITTESFLKKSTGDVRIKNRWYVGLEGFLRNDQNTISNTFDGLIDTQSPTVAAFGASLGWVARENWTAELEYDREAVHNVLIINGDNPLIYRLENDKNMITLRGKRRLVFGKSEARKSAFWVGVGGVVIPNSGKQKSYMEFSGYKERGRRQGIDTLFMTSDTYANHGVTFLAEATAEYIVKVSKLLDMSIYARKQWGFTDAMTTNLVYSVNGVETEQSVIKGNGSGWSFGLSFRYMLHLGYDFDRVSGNSSKSRRDNI